MAEDIVKNHPVHQYNSSIHDFKLADVRLFVSEVQDLIKREGNSNELYWGKQTTIIANHTLGMLLQHLLYSAQDDPLHESVNLINLTEYFLGEEVCGLMRNLLNLSGGSICILDGLVDTLNSRKSDFSAYGNDQAMNHVVVLVSFLSKILLDANGMCQLIQNGDSGAVMKVLAYSSLSIGLNNMHNRPSENLYTVPSDDIDHILAKVIEPMLRFETAKSINIPFEADRRNRFHSNKALHFSVALGLFAVTELLLTHPDINASILNINKQCPLEVLLIEIGQKQIYYKNSLAVAKCLLEHEKTLISEKFQDVVSNAFPTAPIHTHILPKSQLDATKEKIQVLLALIAHFTQHTSVSSDLATSFSKILLDKFPTISELKLNDKYNSALKVITKSIKLNGQFGNFNFCIRALEWVVQNGYLIEEFPFHILVDSTYFDATRRNYLDENILHVILNNLFHSCSGILSYPYSKYSLSDHVILQLQILDLVLKHATANVTLCDNKQKTPVDLCILGYFAHMDKKCRLPVLLFLHLIEMLSCHSTANEGLIVEALYALASLDISLEDIPSYKGSREILDEPCADYFKTTSVSKYTSLVSRLCESPVFNVNYINEKGQTITHMTAKRKNAHMTDILVKHKQFNPNIQDNDGNTAMFYIIKNFTKCEDIGRYLKMLKPKLNLKLTNAADETLLTLGNCIEDRRTRGVVKRILQGDRGMTPGKLKNRYE